MEVGDLEAAGLLAGLCSLPPPIAEEDWPPELQLPRPPPPPPPPPPSVLDDSQFLGSMMDTDVSLAPPVLPPPEPVQEVKELVEQPAAVPVPVQVAAQVPAEPVKRKRGRPPKNRDGAAVAAAAATSLPAPKPAAKKKIEDEEEVVCFICFDGGDLVVCDRRGCPKVYHPVCVKREESFFRSRGKWNCGWHICSSCEKAAHFLCYTCTYSQCRGCIRGAKFYSVRGNKGFCDTCFSTIMLIESMNDEKEKKGGVDFDDKTSWEYLFKLYWLDLKGKLLLTSEELSTAKNKVNNFSASIKRKDSFDESYDVSDDEDSSSDSYSGRRKQTNSKKKRRKRRKAQDDGYQSSKRVRVVSNAVDSSHKRASVIASLPGEEKWASAELLEFVGHMRDGNISLVSQFDVQALLLEYIKRNNLRDPHRKSQIICDARLHSLFRKPRVGHFEMLKLLESHFLVKESITTDVGDNYAVEPVQNNEECGEENAKVSLDKRRKNQKRMGPQAQINLDDYAAIDMHNISLLYLRRSLMEDLIDDDETFTMKIAGTFVRIRISGANQKQDMYRLVKVVGTNRLPEKYKVGKKMTNIALEILNLDKKEIITIDAISNQDFTEEECKRLRQSMKCGLINRLKVGDFVEKAKLLQSVKVNDWLEHEKMRLSHLRDRASETGRRKELRECVQKLQLLNTPEERARHLNKIPAVHTDICMNPEYESTDESQVKRIVDPVFMKRELPCGKGTDTFSTGKLEPVLTSNNSSANKISNVSFPPDGNAPIERAEGKDKISEVKGSDAPNHVAKNLGTDNTNHRAAFGSLPQPLPISTSSSFAESDKVWYYKDPSGNVRGPFPLMQLDKWTTYFPRDLRVWHASVSQENSVLLTDVLSIYKKDMIKQAPQQLNSLCQIGITKFPTSVNTGEINPGRSSKLVKSASHPMNWSMPPTGIVSSADMTLPELQRCEDGNSLHDKSIAASYVPFFSSTGGSPNSVRGNIQGGNFGELHGSKDARALCSPTKLQETNLSSEREQDQHVSQQAHANQCQNNFSKPKGLQLNNECDFRSSVDIHSPSTAFPRQTVGKTSCSKETGTTAGAVGSVVLQLEGCGAPGSTNKHCEEYNFPIISVQPVKNIASLRDPVENEDTTSAAAAVAANDSEKAEDFGSSLTLATGSASEVVSCSENDRQIDASYIMSIHAAEPKNEQISLLDIKDCQQKQFFPLPTPGHQEPSVILLHTKSPEISAIRISDSSLDARELFTAESSLKSQESAFAKPPESIISALDSEPSAVNSDKVQSPARRGFDCQIELNRQACKMEADEAFNAGPTIQTSLSMGLEPSTKESFKVANLNQVEKLEEFTAVPAVQEDTECCSVIAVSPWSDPNFFPAEPIESPIWDAQDDLQNDDIWSSLPSPTPGSKPIVFGQEMDSAADVDQGKDTTSETHKATGWGDGDNNPSKDKLVDMINCGWDALPVKNSDKSSVVGLTPQQYPKQNADCGIGVEGVPAAQIPGLPAAGMNYRPSGWEVDAPCTDGHRWDGPSKRSVDPNPSWGSGGGNKNWNGAPGHLDWTASRKNHDDRYHDDWYRDGWYHDDRYQENSEPWRAGGNYTPRSRTDGYGGAGYSKPPRAQPQRIVCKFHESGYCRKGSACKYLHQ